MMAEGGLIMKVPPKRPGLGLITLVSVSIFSIKKNGTHLRLHPIYINASQRLEGEFHSDPLVSRTLLTTLMLKGSKSKRIVLT